ncbi:hypothetical protein LINGRAHAP2_LOCUS4560, partial [Linum grandiflorum]
TTSEDDQGMDLTSRVSDMATRTEDLSKKNSRSRRSETRS